MEQLSLLDIPEENKKEEEKIIIKDLKISEYMTTEIVKINGVPYIRQQLKEKRRWPVGHKWESENRPFTNELCEGCLREAFISELNEFGKCKKHGNPKRRT